MVINRNDERCSQKYKKNVPLSFTNFIEIKIYLLDINQ